MTYIPEGLRRLVVERAGGRCEYCLLGRDDSFMPHEVDHIIADKHGGETSEENLCLSCHLCNRHKGTDLASLDPQTRQRVFLFHPRQDNWADHFQLDGARIEPLTPEGRVTARILQFNTLKRVEERLALIAAGRYP